VYLTDHLAKREEIAELVKTSFKDRNALVHGGARSPEEKAKAAERVQKLEELVRDALTRLAEEIISGSGYPTVKDFDGLLLEGRQRNTLGSS
jgi:hypothetical protein